MRTVLALLTLAVFTHPVPARAGTITFDTGFTGVGVLYHYEPLGDIGRLDSPLGSVTVTGAGSDLGAAIDGQTFEAYCVEIFGPIFDPGVAQVGDTADATAAPMSTWAFNGSTTPPPSAGDAAERGTWAGWLYSRNVGTASANDDIERTALLMAIWNVLYDYTETLSTLSVAPDGSDFYVRTAAVETVGNAFLSDLSLNFFAQPQASATWLQLSNACDSQGNCVQDVQDFIGPAGATPPVPEPGSLLLLTTGILGTLAARSRRRKN